MNSKNILYLVLFIALAFIIYKKCRVLTRGEKIDYINTHAGPHPKLVEMSDPEITTVYEYVRANTENRGMSSELAARVEALQQKYKIF